MNKTVEQDLISLFKATFSQAGDVAVERLPPSGSYREYLRIENQSVKVMGTWNEDERENKAFISFSKHFKSQGILVPEIYAYQPDKSIYLQEDLGDETLFSFLSRVREVEGFSEKIVSTYRKVIRDLPRIQVVAGKGINYDDCYPRKAFDRQSMMWDLNYFKYYFLKLAKIPFNEQLLEDDFDAFVNYLLNTERQYFMFRDFQSRNIMIRDGEPWYIDYQGGRQGALQYDLASLLYDSKADIPEAVRESLIEQYLDELQLFMPVDRKAFKQAFYGYVLIRMMQAMGAYGFRGFYEKKEHFLKSIPFALQNLEVVLTKVALPIALDELIGVLRSLPSSEVLKNLVPTVNVPSRLTIQICSFSYKNGYPKDEFGDGGGFVFDCRSVENPGRYEPYKNLTGKDQPVIQFLEQESDMGDFLKPVCELVTRAVERYLRRNFNRLSVAFGCTGGQHRSVYAAEYLAKYLQENFPVNVVTHHLEQEKKL